MPQTHELEAWSDLRSSDGTASLVQPLIRPLFRSWTAHELLALLTGRGDASPYDLVRETWRPQGGNDFEGWWTRALHDGVIAGGRAATTAPSNRQDFRIFAPAAPASTAHDPRAAAGPQPVGRHLCQQCVAAGVPEAADQAGVGQCAGAQSAGCGKTRRSASGDVVTLAANGRQIEAPVIVEPGMADGVTSLTLGLGRSKAGAIGNGIGVNAYCPAHHRPSLDHSRCDDRKDRAAGRRSSPPRTWSARRKMSASSIRCTISPRRQSAPPAAEQAKPSLLPERPKPDDGHAWAMVIDAAVCIGCNACVVACQSENNVAVVGPEEVARGRDMHWLRVDVYDHGTEANPKLGFQPVPCMHCEHAPCEPVCPVAASVHDGEGLNLQVYNRCVGTRFCEANCPYKVRRFNFFGYADGQEYANLGFEAYRAQKNPEVTVRARGVMEKCTYCVQRISAARRAAERDDRPIGTDEVKTACQSACPTSAISFGDLHQKDSAVNRQKADPRHYALLEHLGTRPRTTYLADVRNPAPGFDEGGT